jgi:hypothetical protein
MRTHSADLFVLADRDCLVTFAAMALCCDNGVFDHEMGYHRSGGTAYITAMGVMRRTGLSQTAADRALHRLEAAGVIQSGSTGTEWRTGADILTPDSP